MGDDGFTGDDVGADCGLDGDVEHLARDQAAQAVDELAPDRLSPVAMHYH